MMNFVSPGRAFSLFFAKANAIGNRVERTPRLHIQKKKYLFKTDLGKKLQIFSSEGIQFRLNPNFALFLKNTNMLIEKDYKLTNIEILTKNLSNPFYSSFKSIKFHQS